jgi:hypothetical protein
MLSLKGCKNLTGFGMTGFKTVFVIQTDFYKPVRFATLGLI